MMVPAAYYFAIGGAGKPAFQGAAGLLLTYIFNLDGILLACKKMLLPFAWQLKKCFEINGNFVKLETTNGKNA